MRVPKRRGEILRSTKIIQDNYLTKEAIEKMKRTLVRLTSERPEAIAEVQRTAEMGDFSENAAYQMAKWKLRRMNNRMIVLEEKIKSAIVIDPSGTDTVQIGSSVVVERDGDEQSFDIVGSQETNPFKGLISYTSPLGVMLMNAKVGDEFTLKATGAKYKVVKIS